MAPYPATFTIYLDIEGKWRWHFRAENGEIVASSEAYNSRESALIGIHSLQRSAEDSPIRDPHKHLIASCGYRSAQCHNCGSQVPHPTPGQSGVS